MKKKFLVLGTICLFGIMSIYAQGGAKNFSWKIINDTLIISGTGNMPNWFPFPPWLVQEHHGEHYYCYFSHAIIEHGFTSIGNHAFTCCYCLKSINIPNTVTKIGNWTFDGTSLQSVILPNGLESISEGALTTRELTSITLPRSIKIIENLAFGGNKNLVSITNLNPVPLVINADVFYEVNISACTLKVPVQSVSAYQRADVWKEFNIEGIEVGNNERSGETDNNEKLLVYPNPNNGSCSITIPEEFMNERFLTLSVYDFTGKLIQQMQIDNENSKKFQLTLDHKIQGEYVIRLGNGKKEYSGMVVFN